MHYKHGGKVYNDISVPEKINPTLVMSAFANPIDEQKVQDYTEIMQQEMLGHDFPPIMGFPRVISEEDVGEYFLTGEQIEDTHIGQKVWVVTDGHHRTLAAINAGLPYINTELDYSTVTNMDEYYADGGEVSSDFDEKLKGLITPDMISEMKQLIESHYETKIEEYKKQLESIDARDAEITAKENEIWQKEKQEVGEAKYALFKERMQLTEEKQNLIPAKRYAINRIKALENKGSIVSISDKKGLVYDEVPDFTTIAVQMYAFDEDTILENAIPEFVPEINDKKYASKGYVFDAMRLAPDKYLIATNGFSNEIEKQAEKYTGQEIAIANGYVLVSLDQLVLINNYYFTLAKANLAAEAERRSENNKKAWFNLSEQKREQFLSQKGLYHSLPAKIRKTISQSEYEALTWQEKEKIYQFYKRYGSKRITTRLDEHHMWSSFHSMFERFLNPEATLVEKRYANPQAWSYWQMLRDFLNWKIKDLKIQNEENSEQYKNAIETAFGFSNTNDSLKNEYGILVKRQDGSQINAAEIHDIIEAWIAVCAIIGNLKTLAITDNLKISHTGKKYIFASKAVGVYVPDMLTIGVSNKYGEKMFSYTLAHEVAHWIDNYLGKNQNKKWLTNDYESLAGKIAFDFRKNMNRKVSSEYANQTKECFARAIEQYFAIEKDGYDAQTEYMMYATDKDKQSMPYITSDYYVSRDAYDNIIKPQIVEFLKQHSEIFTMKETTNTAPTETNKAEKDYSALVYSFMNNAQKQIVKNSDEFDDIINELGETITNMPSTGETDGQGKDAIAYLHYFKGGSDWYITEKDSEKKQLQAFGYVVLNGDYQFAEFGYISIEELKQMGVELDFHWKPKSIREILNEKEPVPQPTNVKTEEPTEEQTEEMFEAELAKQKAIYENPNSSDEEKNAAFMFLVENDFEFADTFLPNVTFTKFDLTEPYQTIAVFPQINKLNTIAEYMYNYGKSDEKRKANAHLKTRIVKATLVNNRDFILLKNSLLNDNAELYERQVGGTNIDDIDVIAAGYNVDEFNQKFTTWSFTPKEEEFVRKHMYEISGIVINSDTCEHYLYNTEGYDYARYAGWIANNANDAVNEIRLLLASTTEPSATEPAITINEMDELQKKYHAIFEDVKAGVTHFLKMGTINKSIQRDIENELKKLYEPEFEPFLKQTLEYQASLPTKAQIMLDVDYFDYGLIKKNIWHYIPSQYKKVQQVPKIAYTLSQDDKGLAKIIKPFVSTDGLRLNLLGVNFDKYGVTATDAMKMLFIKGKILSDAGLYCLHPNCYKILGSDEIKEDNDKFVKFPDYSRVIPMDNKSISINVKSMMLYIESMLAVKYHNIPVTKIIIIYTGGDKNDDNNYIGFNGEYLLDGLKAMLQMGYEKIDFGFSAPHRAALLTPIGNVNEAHKLKTTFALIMPILKTNSYADNNAVYLNDFADGKLTMSYYDITNESVGMLGVDAESVVISETSVAIEEATEKAKQIAEQQKAETNKKLAEVKMQLQEIDAKKKQIDETLDTENRKKTDTEKSAVIENYSVLRYTASDGKEAIRVQNLSVDEEIDNPEIYRLPAENHTNTEAVEIAKRIFEDRRNYAEKTAAQRMAEEVQSIDDLKESLENAIIALEFVENAEERKELEDYIEGLKTVIEIGI